MKRYDLLRVDAPPASFEELLRQSHAAGLRVGWLEWDPGLDERAGEEFTEESSLEPSAPPARSLAAPIPASLEAAAGLGVLRAVAVTAGGSVAVKRRQGRPVERDLVREHFAGCRLILVAGGLARARLHPCGDGWEISCDEASARRYSTVELVRRLASPRPLVAPASASTERA